MIGDRTSAANTRGDGLWRLTNRPDGGKILEVRCEICKMEINLSIPVDKLNEGAAVLTPGWRKGQAPYTGSGAQSDPLNLIGDSVVCGEECAVEATRLAFR